MAELKVDFYTVYLPDDEDVPPFEAILRAVIARPPLQRVVMVAGGWVTLARCQGAGGRVRGVIVKVKADELPVVADRLGNLEDMRLREDQGLTDPAHFLYFPGNRVLLLARRWRGLAAPGFEDYVGRVADVPVELRPIIPPDVMARLNRMQEIRAIELRITDASAQQYLAGGASIRRVIDVMTEYDAPVAEIRLSIGRRRHLRLNRNRTVALARQLLRAAEHQAVDRAILTGLDPEEERTLTLDLLRDKMVERIPVDTGPGRHPTDADAFRALEAAHARRQPELIELFGA